jgi:hypothetical protein
MHHFRHVVQRPQLERLGCHRPGEDVALQLVAPHAHQQVTLGLGLDAFGHHAQAQRVSHLHDGLRDRTQTKARSIFSSAAGRRRSEARLE